MAEYPKRMIYFILLLFFILPGAWGNAVQIVDGTPVVRFTETATATGTLNHSRDGQLFCSFVGIEYAHFKERFDASEPLLSPSWTGVKNFTTPGPWCSQPFLGGSTQGKERCLYLNIYAPIRNASEKPFPVIIFLHGGGFMIHSGYGHEPHYFLDHRVILITANYRLGVHGFLSTQDGLIPGNNGIKDVLNLLKWVRHNIHHFGGNPGLVTLWGQSAGGAIAHHLMFSPAAKGLFHRAIGESGNALFFLGNDPHPRENAIDFARYFNCSAGQGYELSSADILHCLRQFSAEQINLGQFEYRQSFPPYVRPFYFPPTPEPEGSPNAIITKYPLDFLSGDEPVLLDDVPWMVGAMQDEGGVMYSAYVLEDPDLLQEFNTDWEKVAPLVFDYGRYPFHKEITEKISQFYFGSARPHLTLGPNRVNLTNLMSDTMVAYTTRRAALDMARKGSKVFLYNYAYPGPKSVTGSVFFLKGPETKLSCHIDDLQHFFPLAEELYPGFGNPILKNTPDEEFSKNLVKLWVTFAETGEPSHTWGNGSDTWEPVSRQNNPAALKWWRLDSEPGYVTEPYERRWMFWDKLCNEYFIPYLRNQSSTTSVK